MASNVSSFTKSGKQVSGTRRAGVSPTPLGRLDPTTGRVWQKPRLTANPISGRSVRVTNPKGSNVSMTGGMGMGGVGQRGRNRDVGSGKARGEA